MQTTPLSTSIKPLPASANYCTSIPNKLDQTYSTSVLDTSAQQYNPITREQSRNIIMDKVVVVVPPTMITSRTISVQKNKSLSLFATHMVNSTCMAKQNIMPQSVIRKNRQQQQQKNTKKADHIRESSQHIVFINNEAYIASKKSPYNKDRISPKRVIGLSNKSKQKCTNIRRLQSPHRKTSISKVVPAGRVPSIFYTTLQSPNKNVSDLQALTRKIKILQARVFQLHNQKQQMQLKYVQQIKNMYNQSINKDKVIQQLENQSKILTIKIQNQQKFSKQLQQKLQKTQEQKQKMKRDLQCQKKTQILSPTQNFINLTLSQEIQNLKKQKNTLFVQVNELKYKLKIIQVQKSLASKFTYEETTYNDNQPNQYTKNKQNAQNYQNGSQSSITKKKDEQCEVQLNANLNQQLSEQILQIESQQFHIQQIVQKITKLSKQNQDLKSQIQQLKSQIQIKDTVAGETAKIIQQIKNLAGCKEPAISLFATKQNQTQQYNHQVIQNQSNYITNLRAILSQL